MPQTVKQGIHFPIDLRHSPQLCPQMVQWWVPLLKMSMENSEECVNGDILSLTDSGPRYTDFRASGKSRCQSADRTLINLSERTKKV